MPTAAGALAVLPTLFALASTPLVAGGSEGEDDNNSNVLIVVLCIATVLVAALLVIRNKEAQKGPGQDGHEDAYWAFCRF